MKWMRRVFIDLQAAYELGGDHLSGAGEKGWGKAGRSWRLWVWLGQISIDY